MLKKILAWGWVLLGIAAAVLLACLLKTPIRYLYREVSFTWQEQTEAEHRVHDYAKEQGDYAKSMAEALENTGVFFEEDSDPTHLFD